MSVEAEHGIRTYVLRSGRMTDAQKRALEGLLPRYGLDFEPSERLDLMRVFGNSKPVVAEIGFGMGQATWKIARASPSFNYLGIEVHAPGVGRLLMELEAHGIDNVRVIMHDAIEVFESMLRPSALAGLHLFYPDPWPKKRHNKRRLVREGLAGLLSSRLAPGGYLYFVTDVEDYALWSLDVLTRTEGLRNRYDGFATPQEWRPETKFEAHASRDGRGRWELLFEKEPYSKKEESLR
jgi:tRNA (guanine-N7-)-methyltransferase